MGEQTSITLQKDAKERLNDSKPDDMSWTEFAYGITEDGEMAESSGEPQGTAIDGQLQEVLSALKTIEERTGRLEKQLDDIGGY